MSGLRFSRAKVAVLCAALVVFGLLTQIAQAERPGVLILPEQRWLQVRDPSQMRPIRLPDTMPPPTVSRPEGLRGQIISLDDVLRISLGNSQVVRVLAGVTAVSSGNTVYDPAISNTIIDQQRARFDPVLSVSNTFNRVETPIAALDPLDPLNALVGSLRNDNYNMNLNLSQTNVLGGTATFNVLEN